MMPSKLSSKDQAKFSPLFRLTEATPIRSCKMLNSKLTHGLRRISHTVDPQILQQQPLPLRLNQWLTLSQRPLIQKLRMPSNLTKLKSNHQRQSQKKNQDKLNNKWSMPPSLPQCQQTSNNNYNNQTKRLNRWPKPLTTPMMSQSLPAPVAHHQLPKYNHQITQVLTPPLSKAQATLEEILHKQSTHFNNKDSKTKPTKPS